MIVSRRAAIPASEPTCEARLLGAAPPGRPGSGPVRLVTEADHPFVPATGEPTRQTCADDASLASNRRFGQGSSLRAGNFTVPAKCPDGR